MIVRKNTVKGVATTVTGTLLLAGMVALPVSIALPEKAHAVEVKIAQAQKLGENLAITERPMEEVIAPESYSDSTEKDASDVQAERSELQPADTPADADSEEMSLARALVSSSTAIVGVTFPRANAEPGMTVSYRQRVGNEWSEWIDMEVSDAPVEAVEAGTAVQGTEPIPLTNIDEVEAQVTTADGRSIPGVMLHVIEPELTPATLEEAQEIKHGIDEVQAAESILNEVTEAQAVHPSVEKRQQTENEQLTQDSHANASLTDVIPALTPAEEAEKHAELAIPDTQAGAQGIPSALVLKRAVGPTADGKAYVTDIPGLTITTRKGWGADESLMDWDPEPVTFRGAVVHHTAGSNNYTKSQVPNVVRGVYHFHAVTRGWGDVGYHLLVDKFGGVWEGRAGGLTKAVEGGHALGANTATFGISVLGDYMKVRPSDEAIDAVAKAVAWKLRLHGIRNVNGTINVKGKQWGKSSVDIPVIAVHRQVGGTTCPGDAFMTRVPEIQAKAAAYMTSSLKPRAEKKTEEKLQRYPQWGSIQQIGHGWDGGRVLAAGAFSASGRTDAILVDTQGRMWLYPGHGEGNFVYGRTQIGHGWQGLDQLTGGVDFDGDDNPDIIARHKESGNLLLYSGNGRGWFKGVRTIGYGWNGFSRIYVLSGMEKNGHPIVFGTHPNGLMRAYLTDGRGAFKSMRIVGGGWNVMREMSSVGDKTGDGLSDFVVIDTQGRLWLYEGTGDGSHGKRYQIGHGWNGLNTVVRSVSDGTLWAVHQDGRFLRYRLVTLH